MNSIPAKAKADPTKQFFVHMITRDISLEDCILDLIDNSIDGAWKMLGSKPAVLSDEQLLIGYRIEINTRDGAFSIVDNCGGMSLDDAADHAFNFGRKLSVGSDNYSIGVYGIGMKRAIFKIGTDIRVRSTYREADRIQSFAVPINVDTWLTNDAPPWDFDLVEDEALPEAGVSIAIKTLTAGAANSFANPLFEENLRRTIARDYSIHLGRGLSIALNGTSISGVGLRFLESEEFRPVRISYEEKIGDDEVHVEIIAGMAAPPPEDLSPDSGLDGDKRFGWYVVCNGRIVLAADKGMTSGWGSDDWPQWHYQYAGFVGVILFYSEKASALPLTTTKRSVDVTSEVFLRARPKMREATKVWIAYTNSRKQMTEEAKTKEALAKPVSITEVKSSPVVTLPILKLAYRPAEKMANVSYSVPLKRLKALARGLGNVNMAYRDVGLKSFEYAFDDHAESE